MRPIDILRKMMATGLFDNNTFETIIPDIKNLPIVPIIMPIGAKIIRSSSNNDNTFHNNVSRLNYPPVENAHLARANMEGEQMFYASVFNTFDEKDEKYAIPPRVVSAFETSYLFKDLETSGRMITTQSLWLATRPLRLLVLPNTKEWKKPSRELRALQEFIRNNDSFKNSYSDESHKLAEYIGNLFAETAHSCLYEITSRTTHLLLNDSIYADNIDGIAYPSVKCNGVGFNICVKPSVVDECIKFQGATVTMIMKENKNTTIFEIAHSVLFKGGTLNWRPTKGAIQILVSNYGSAILNNPNILESQLIDTSLTFCGEDAYQSLRIS